MRDRPGLAAGVALLLVGAYLLLRRAIPFSGPGPILLLIGAVFFLLSALRSFRGPVLPGAILLGLGAGFLARGPLEPWLPRWATLLLGLGAGFLLVSAIDAANRRPRKPDPLVPGLILTAIAAAAAVSRLVDLEAFVAGLSLLWPWLLVAAGVALVFTALRKRA